MFRPSIHLFKNLSNITIFASEKSTRLINNQQSKYRNIENTVSVSPLSAPVNKHWLRMKIAELLELEGESLNGIVEVRTVHDGAGTRYGIGFVELANQRLASNLLDCKGVKIDRLDVTFKSVKAPIDPPNNPMPGQKPSTTSSSSRTIYVSNLPYYTSSQTLKQTFCSFGKINTISIPMREDSFGLTRGGSALVTFDKKQVAEEVMKVAREKGILVGDRQVVVHYKSRKDRGLRKGEKKELSDKQIIKSQGTVAESLRVKREVVNSDLELGKQAERITSANPDEMRLEKQELENAKEKPQCNNQCGGG